MAYVSKEKKQKIAAALKFKIICTSFQGVRYQLEKVGCGLPGQLNPFTGLPEHPRVFHSKNEAEKVASVLRQPRADGTPGWSKIEVETLQVSD